MSCQGLSGIEVCLRGSNTVVDGIDWQVRHDLIINSIHFYHTFYLNLALLGTNNSLMTFMHMHKFQIFCTKTGGAMLEPRRISPCDLESSSLSFCKWLIFLLFSQNPFDSIC